MAVAALATTPTTETASAATALPAVEAKSAAAAADASPVAAVGVPLAAAPVGMSTTAVDSAAVDALATEVLGAAAAPEGAPAATAESAAAAAPGTLARSALEAAGLGGGAFLASSGVVSACRLYFFSSAQRESTLRPQNKGLTSTRMHFSGSPRFTLWRSFATSASMTSRAASFFSVFLFRARNSSAHTVGLASGPMCCGSTVSASFLKSSIKGLQV